VLYMKNLNTGPTLFVNNAASVYAVFLLFILANLLMLPFGWAAIKSFKQVLRLPRKALLPCILVFCILGAFAINNSVVGIGMMLGFGVLAWLMEENGIPVAPAILGMVLGTLLEEHFITSMIKSDGNPLAFFDRPISGTLAAMMIALIVIPTLARLLRKRPT
ncbi:MAG: tripartite tricarboxylate transporter permease, partial [Reyranella sp.]|nr:tripartite tricarboxylate transporter permease [Reyranella sp.]